MTPDIINGLFEAAGAAFCFLSVRRLHRDKLVRGVSWPGASFFAAWGWWNLAFYPAVGCWWSFLGAGLLAATNSLWLVQLIYYTRRERRAS